jgi:hypothetical protein
MRRKEILNPALVHKKVFTEAEREFFKRLLFGANACFKVSNTCFFG